MADDGVVERGPSRTALGIAAHRAVHQLVDGQPRILDDPIAARLLDQPMLDAILSRADAIQSEAARALRSHVILRSRYAEDRLAEAARRGVGQCVILGAGFDTFAYRQPGWAKRLRIFEVDHQASQDEKRRRLDRAGVPIPGNVEFVAIDFETVSLRDGLRASTLDFAGPTFFSCLGVLVYLTAEATDAIFELVARFPAGSEIAFTFSAPRASPSAVALSAAAAGEPWLSAIEPVALERKLLDFGFSAVSFLEPKEAKTAYFPQARLDGLTAPGRISIGAAIVG